VATDVKRALDEDVGSGDLTAALVPAERQVLATIVCREAAVICGEPWVTEVLRQLSPTAQATWHVRDGQRCTPWRSAARPANC
jgi:nicotinate-nucleotide pyrophosphorylase (carboxylating)